ncbi:hypothetical protein AGABI2DRAFT_46135, partial [Agaricus bisporus var. bisporus H97]|uniref:hypothetical protein n=1 Tax=Agaricus bisporus var. bisporus (strain H97 / ATCC MYA-4626 / FGSC 10389) TaxID=936046 RepID=UPI00029F640A
HTITVGADNLKKFEPNNITAAVNDVVRFHFVSKNHTSTQSSLNDPCTTLEGPDGTPLFDTGFQVINPSNPNQVTFDFMVNDTKPKWGYCQQVGHCGSGMVWAINGGE